MATPSQIAAGGSSGSGVFGSGFLWKPAGDHTGQLVILTPKGYSDADIQSVTVNGETGRYTGLANGDRGHWRFNRPGSAYGSTEVVITMKDGSVHRLPISNGALRYENGSTQGTAAGLGGTLDGGLGGVVNAEPGPNQSFLSDLFRSVFQPYQPGGASGTGTAKTSFTFGDLADAVLGVSGDYDTTAGWLRGLEPGKTYNSIDELKAALPGLDQSNIPARYQADAQNVINQALGNLASGKLPGQGQVPGGNLVTQALQDLLAGNLSPSPHDPMGNILQGAFFDSLRRFGPGQGTAQSITDGASVAFANMLRGPMGTSTGLPGSPFGATMPTYAYSTQNPFGLPGMPSGGSALGPAGGQGVANANALIEAASRPQYTTSGAPQMQQQPQSFGAFLVPQTTTQRTGVNTQGTARPPGYAPGAAIPGAAAPVPMGSINDAHNAVLGGFTSTGGISTPDGLWATPTGARDAQGFTQWSPGQRRNLSFGELLLGSGTNQGSLYATGKGSPWSAGMATQHLNPAITAGNLNPGVAPNPYANGLPIRPVGAPYLLPGGGGLMQPGAGGAGGGAGGGFGSGSGGGFGPGGSGSGFFSNPNNVAPGILPSLVQGNIPAPVQAAFDLNLQRALAEMAEGFGASGARFGTDLAGSMGQAIGNANIGLMGDTYNRSIDAYNALTNNALGFYNTGVQRELGLGNLDLQRLLGLGELGLQGQGLNIQQQLGLGNLALNQSQLQAQARARALDQILGLGTQLGGWDFLGGQNALDRALQEYLGQISRPDPLLNFLGGGLLG